VIAKKECAKTARTLWPSWSKSRQRQIAGLLTEFDDDRAVDLLRRLREQFWPDVVRAVEKT
jgi:hypothetical protein